MLFIIIFGTLSLPVVKTKSRHDYAMPLSVQYTSSRLHATAGELMAIVYSTLYLVSVCIRTFAPVPRPILEYCSCIRHHGWLGSRVVSVLDPGAEGPGFKSQPRRCRVTVLGRLVTPVVPLFTKQQNW